MVGDLPDAALYQPFYAPWAAPAFTTLYGTLQARTLCPPASAWTLHTLLRQALHVPGDVMEAGVYQGGTARLLRLVIDAHAPGRTLHLFDSFAGMARTDAAADRHRAGDFADTSAEAVRRFVGGTATLHAGWIPESFAGLEGLRLCFAHVDLDLHESILDTLAFVYPRLSPGGVIVFDDYGYASCPGARAAVDHFFADKREVPLALQTGQAVVIRL